MLGCEDENLGVKPAIWKLGGGSSKLGRVGASGLRAFNDCGVASASSACPIPGGGIASAARLTDGYFDNARGRQISAVTIDRETGRALGTRPPAGAEYVALPPAPKAQYRSSNGPPGGSGGSRRGGQIVNKAILLLRPLEMTGWTVKIEIAKRTKVPGTGSLFFSFPFRCSLFRPGSRLFT